MPRSHAILPVLLAAACGPLAACHSDTPPRPADRESLRESWNPLPFDNSKAAADTSFALAQGPAPLVYITDAPGTIRIVDLTTNLRLVAAPAPTRTLISIDAKRGVLFGDKIITPGPLLAGHLFAIYLDYTPPPPSSQPMYRAPSDWHRVQN